jgi:ribosomal protein L2
VASESAIMSSPARLDIKPGNAANVYPVVHHHNVELRPARVEDCRSAGISVQLVKDGDHAILRMLLQ